MVCLCFCDDMVGEVLGNQIFVVIKEGTGGNVEMCCIEFVGLNVGDEFIEVGGLVILVFLLCILFYVLVCFEWCLVVGVVLVLVYDVIIILGIFFILQIEVDFMIVVVLLMVVGYLFNDIIVVFDWICENFCKMCKEEFVEIMNSLII